MVFTLKDSRWLITIFLIVAALIACSPTEQFAFTSENGKTDEPVALLLTWQQDPTTTMTIDWQTTPGDPAVPTLLYTEAGGEDWSEVRAEQLSFPYSGRTIHRVEITGLQPATYYHFRVGEFERQYKFRTMPDSNFEEPVVFAIGGDTRPGKWTFEPHYGPEVGNMEDLNRIALDYDVDFIVWGGDFAYADSREDRLYRWYWWFEANMNSLIDEDGRIVPVIVAIGNHETLYGRYQSADDYEETDTWRENNAVYFYNLFAFPGQPGYGVLDFGDYLSLISLDTDHTNPVDGTQTEWLRQVLTERVDVPHIFPFYHIPAFPSHRNPNGEGSVRVRENWVPLFEEFNVRVAFENHDHAYKRTFPVRNGEINPMGITYIGDGAWGRGPRSGNSQDEWYIHRFADEIHAVITTIHGTHQHFLMVNEKGDIIDEYPRTAKQR